MAPAHYRGASAGGALPGRLAACAFLGRELLAPFLTATVTLAAGIVTLVVNLTLLLACRCF